MKTPASTPFSRKVAALLVVIGSLFSASITAAQPVFLSFSGGGGGNAPLTITWNDPIVFTLTGNASASGGEQPFFVFNGVGDVYNNSQAPAVDGPFYAGFEGTVQINNIFSGQILNDVSADDIVATHYPTFETTRMLTGATFVLSAGTLTTGQAYFGTLPSDGYYSTFITDASFSLLGAGASAIPEPSTYAAIAGVAMLGIAVWQRRRRVIMSAGREA